MNYPAEMMRLIEVSTSAELHEIMMSADQNTLDTGLEEGWMDAQGYSHDTDREARVFVSSYASLCDDLGVSYPKEV